MDEPPRDELYAQGAEDLMNQEGFYDETNNEGQQMNHETYPDEDNYPMEANTGHNYAFPEEEKPPGDYLNDGADLSGDYVDSDTGGFVHGGEYGESVGDATGDGSTAIPDMMVLNVLCAQAKAPKDSGESVAEAEESWQAVREWLSSHDAETVRAAAQQRGESGLTALHFACRNVPPLDVIDVFLSIAADTVQWPDSFGWLPVHYACASGSDTEVIKALTESFPESKTTTDRRRRTPLHFALGEKPASPEVIHLLSSTGAASYPDEIGMLVSYDIVNGFLERIFVTYHCFCFSPAFALCLRIWCIRRGALRLDRSVSRCNYCS